MSQETINAILIIGCAGFLAWALILSAFFVRALRAYRKITKGISKKDLRTILNELSNSIKQTSNDVNALNEDVKQLNQNVKSHIQKVGFVRFNPFSDTGGNQSFCACLLDEYDSGIVITSLHNRDQTRIYAKKIINGKPENRELSSEEKEVINQALKAKKKQ